MSEHTHASSSETAATETPRVVEGRFECPEGLVVAVECLGRSYPTVIGEQALTLKFPSTPEDPSRSQSNLVAPESHYAYPPRRTDSDHELPDWGSISHFSAGIPQSARVAMVGFTFTTTGTDEDASHTCEMIEGDLDNWWERASMWLDIYSELNLLRHGRRKPGILGARYSAYLQHADGKVKPVSWTSHGIFRFPRLIQLPSLEELTTSFRAAGEGAVLPQEWQYLRDARSWLEAGQTRRAVIDGCTAAEVALTNQLDRLLRSTDTAVKSELLLRCPGVAELGKLVRALGGITASRNRLEEKLAKVRNLAVHAGAEPSIDVATLALEVAAEAVEHARPLAQLHSTI
ncbi:hypothetical protein ACFVVM_03685 [Nocardia sp. NPDC058176]|uniref:hypothetical protein n=1 Tax=Nocardia sp. NPDC058176 TaxID=3346368 RepID=UPI0036DB6853